MKKYMTAAAVVLALPALGSFMSQARAEIDYPYCLTYSEGWGGLVERCDYSTMEQCRMSAGGLNGSCDYNRRMRFAPDNAPQRRRATTPR